MLLCRNAIECSFPASKLVTKPKLLTVVCRVGEYLGSGEFGTGHKGEWLSPMRAVEVALKTLKPGSDEGAMVKFLQEAAINGQFRHRNVVKLHGVVTVGDPV